MPANEALEASLLSIVFEGLEESIFDVFESKTRRDGEIRSEGDIFILFVLIVKIICLKLIMVQLKLR